MKKTSVPGVLRKGQMLYVKSESTAFGERLYKWQDELYRPWDPTRSKIGAGIMNGVPVNLTQDSIILYLGASHGYTVSFLSTLVPNGMIFAVDLGEVVMRDLYLLAEDTKNIVPVLESANHTDNYAKSVPTPDIIIQDIAQKNQAAIFIKNIKRFASKDTHCLFSVKCASIDVAKKPKEVRDIVLEQLQPHCKNIKCKTLDPWEKDHYLISCQLK